jgi:hypothetical protein
MYEIPQISVETTQLLYKRGPDFDTLNSLIL